MSDLDPFERETKHAEKALANRAGPYQIPGTANMMTPILEFIQELEDVFWQIFDARVLADATGDALDILGAIVGEDRKDDTEDIFRLRISLALRAIYSKKKRADFLSILGLLEGTAWALWEKPGVAIFVQTEADQAYDSATVFRFLSIASADGVLVRYESFEDETGDDLFTWPSYDGTITGGEWKSYDGTIAGGAWPGLQCEGN